MARPTAPSQWLPGFDPAAPALPRPAEQVCLSVSCVPAEPVEVIHVENLIDVEQEQSVATVRANWRVVATATDAAPRILWPQLIRTDLEHLTGPTAKFEANLAAITLLREIEAEVRPASTDDRQVLRRYTGWGGLPASFNLEAARQRLGRTCPSLAGIAPAEDYESARASVNNSHYTEVHVIEAIWQAVERFGFTGGRILEPAAGIGHFIGAMPRNLAERSRSPPSRSTGFPAASSRRSTRPAAWMCGFRRSRKLPLPDHWFDLVIGNVPFGKYKVADVSNRAYARFSIHNYFFGRALDLVRPGGLVCFITSSHTMDAQYDAVREYIASRLTCWVPSGSPRAPSPASRPPRCRPTSCSCASGSGPRRSRRMAETGHGAR
jgi:hypothetical protein